MPYAYAGYRIFVAEVASTCNEEMCIRDRNKVAPPFKEAEFDIMFGKGISREGDVLDLAVKLDVIQKSGAWFAYNGNKIGQGRENSKIYLKEHPEVMDEVEAKVRTSFGLQGAKAAVGPQPGTAGEPDMAEE